MEQAMMVDGKPIRQDGEMWCLTDLWRASGVQRGKSPHEWLRKAGAPFVEFLNDSLNTANGRVGIVRVNRGGNDPQLRATWAHWQIALAYAKSLSHPFHARVNEVYRAFMAGQLSSKPNVPALEPGAFGALGEPTPILMIVDVADERESISNLCKAVAAKQGCSVQAIHGALRRRWGRGRVGSIYCLSIHLIRYIRQSLEWALNDVEPIYVRRHAKRVPKNRKQLALDLPN